MAGNMDEIRQQVNDAIASSGSRIIGMVVDAGRASQIRREDLQDIKLKLDNAKTRRAQVPPAVQGTDATADGNNSSKTT